jgi:hypothetical protein
MAKQKELYSAQYYNPGEKIDYEEIVSEFPWIIEKDQKAILSPDSDGFLCGLLMSKFLDWQIVGFYDGKVLILKEGLSLDECIFLDMDIYRENVRSVGHHMVMFNKNALPSNWNNYNNCIQACNLRNFDKTHDWQRKYPLGTIHLLLGILGSQGIIESLSKSKKSILPPNSEIPLLFSDGTWINLFDYMENVLDWIGYLGFEDSKSVLYPIFCDNDTIYNFMKTMNAFLRIRDGYNAVQTVKDGNVTSGKVARSGHALRISDKTGHPINLVSIGQQKYEIEHTERTRVIGFIKELAKYIDWSYNDSHWAWDNLKLKIFKKTILKSEKGKGFNVARCNDVYENKNPFSLAFTSGTNLEITEE